MRKADRFVMSSKSISFMIGATATILVSLFSWHYLAHKKNKESFQKSNAILDTVETIDYRFNDFKYKLRETKNSAAPVVLVAIDDVSVQEVGRWPWGRDTIAQFLEELLENDVGAVGLDVIFSEPERGFAENDQRLGALVDKYKDRLILGTFSSNELHILPYQDYCVNEAFLASGGDQLVKINPTLIVDDEADIFEDVLWDQIFSIVFADIEKKETANYYRYLNSKNEADLNLFQKNRLNALLQKARFEYCGEWLSSEDRYSGDPQLQKIYSEILAKKFPEMGFDVNAKLKKFKSSIGEHPTPQYGEWVSNIPKLQEPADFTASFIAQLDVDGYVRRYPLFYRSGNRLGTSYVPSLALQTYLRATQYRADVTINKKNGRRAISAFKIIDASGDEEKIVRELPVDTQGQMVLNYYGPQNTLPYVSAKDLLNKSDTVSVFTRVATEGRKNIVIKQTTVDKKEFFKGKAVLVGATSNGIYDLRNTPVEANYPGPELHLTMMANLFDGQFVYPLAKEEYTLPLVLLATGFMLSFLLVHLGSISSIASLVVCLALSGAIDFWLFAKFNLIYSSFFVFSLILGVHFSSIVYKYFSEEKKKRELKRTFSKYVSPAVVDELLKNEENLKLGGRKQEMSVFFSDVRGFTTFSEKMEPDQLSEFLNSYLTPMTEMIFKNKGTLDKYMGDGLMAFFGAPVAFRDHAEAACQAALDSLVELEKLKIEFRKQNLPDIDIGIGINTGSMSVGNMGSKIVQSYTVIGDAVNLGARLESATKQYGVKILVSEATYLAAKDRFLFREVDRVRVKGKNEPIGAFELLSAHKNSAREEYVDKYQEAYDIYLSRDFQAALKLFAALEKERPNDLLVRIYKKRCLDFIETPPETNWDGVYEMKSK
jgi:adenylate cyclase